MGGSNSLLVPPLQEEWQSCSLLGNGSRDENVNGSVPLAADRGNSTLVPVSVSSRFTELGKNHVQLANQTKAFASTPSTMTGPLILSPESPALQLHLTTHFVGFEALDSREDFCIRNLEFCFLSAGLKPIVNKFPLRWLPPEFQLVRGSIQSISMLNPARAFLH